MSAIPETTTHPPGLAGPGAMPRPDGVTMVAFAGVVLIAGANVVAVRFSNRELAPFWGASMRFAAGALLLFAVAAAMKLPVPRGRALLGTLLYGVLGAFLAYAFIYVGLQHVPASLAAPVMASVPLLTFFLAVAHRVERFRWRGLAGGIASLAGIAVLSGAGGTGGAPVKYLLFVLAAAFCVAETGIIVKKFPRVHPIMMNALAMAVGAVMLFALSSVTSERHVMPRASETWVALGFLVIFGSTLLFLLYVTVINRWTVTGASYQFVLFPLVSVVLASWLADEPVTASLASGGALVLAGVYIGALSGRPHLHHAKDRIPEPVSGPPC